jgi:cholesterol oxidase
MPIDAGLRAYDTEVSALLDSILTRNGCRPIRADFVDGSGAPYTDLRVGTAHQTGSCRMADGAEHGVCDARGEVFGYPGLYVTDAAAIPTSLAVNTSLTVVANAERIAAGIIEHGA